MVAHSRASLRADRLRVLNAPVRVEVRLDERGLPREIRDLSDGWDSRGVTSAAVEQEGRRVMEILEVWRIDDEWWREPMSRRYVEVVLEGGGHVVVFESLTTGNWFLQMP